MFSSCDTEKRSCQFWGHCCWPKVPPDSPAMCCWRLSTSAPPPSALEQQSPPHPHVLLHFQQDPLVLLSDGQGGTVNPLVNLLPLLCLKGIESFPSVTHPEDTGSKEGKLSGIPLCVCVSVSLAGAHMCACILHARSKCQLWLYQGLQGGGPWSGDLATVPMG